MMLLATLPRNALLDVKSLVSMQLDWNMAHNASVETWYAIPRAVPWPLKGVPEAHGRLLSVLITSIG